MIAHLVPRLPEFARHRDMDGAWPAVECAVHCRFEDIASLVRMIDDGAIFATGCEHRLGVGRVVQSGGFVERAFPRPVTVGIAGNREHGIRIGHRHCETREEVECAGPRRRPTDAKMVRIHGVAAGHERRRLFMAGDNTADLFRMLERQHHAGRGFTSTAESSADADFLQSGDNRLENPHISPELVIIWEATLFWVRNCST